MTDGDVTDLSPEEIDALTDDERGALNDAAAEEEPDGEPEFDEEAFALASRAQFLDWVMEHFSIVEVTGLKERVRWCPQWYEHPEVVARLHALWQSRVQADQDSVEDLGALSSWWLNHWDRHSAILFNPQTGPFRYCDPTRGHLVDQRQDGPAVTVPVPPDTWQLPRTTA